MLLPHHHFAPARRADVAECQFLVGFVWNSWTWAHASAPSLDLSHPSLPSLPTCHPRGSPLAIGKGLTLTSSPLDSVLGEELCWGRVCVWGAESRGPARTERPQQVSVQHQHRRSQTLWANWRKVATELCHLPNTTVQLCSSERISWVRNRGWNRPGRWQEAAHIRRGGYLPKDGGNWATDHLSFLGIHAAQSLPGCRAQGPQSWVSQSRRDPCSVKRAPCEKGLRPQSPLWRGSS